MTIAERDELICNHLYVCDIIAKKYPYPDFNEARSLCYLALVENADKYDPTRGMK